MLVEIIRHKLEKNSDILSSEFNEWSMLRLPRKCEFRSAQNFLETGQKKQQQKNTFGPFRCHSQRIACDVMTANCAMARKECAGLGGKKSMRRRQQQQQQPE